MADFLAFSQMTNTPRRLSSKPHSIAPLAITGIEGSSALRGVWSKVRAFRAFSNSALCRNVDVLGFYENWEIFKSVETL